MSVPLVNTLYKTSHQTPTRLIKFMVRLFFVEIFGSDTHIHSAHSIRGMNELSSNCSFRILEHKLVRPQMVFTLD